MATRSVSRAVSAASRARVRLRPAEIDALDALAARWGVSRSDAVRMALGHAAIRTT
jgi:hypothetical protein